MWHEMMFDVTVSGVIMTDGVYYESYILGFFRSDRVLTDAGWNGGWCRFVSLEVRR